jgi:hypothetical protein
MPVTSQAVGPEPIQQVPLTSILTDAACQARVQIRPGVVRDYRRAMVEQIGEGGLRFPPIVLFSDGQHHWLADGFHRILAARAAGLSDFPADVRPGTERDALLFSISCNGAHGLPRTNADKRKAVTLLLADTEWSQWSDREIARRCQVSHKFVQKVRRSASGDGRQMRMRKVRRGAAVYEMRAESNSSQPAAPDRAVSTPFEAPSTPATDRVGILLPSETAAAFASLSAFETIEKLHAQLAELVDQLAQSPGGGAFQQHLVRKLKDGKLKFCSPELNIVLKRLRSAMPYCGYCPRCHAKHQGRAHPACQLCGGRGWLSKREFELCPASERKQLAVSSRQ